MYSSQFSHTFLFFVSHKKKFYFFLENFLASRQGRRNRRTREKKNERNFSYFVTKQMKWNLSSHKIAFSLIVTTRQYVGNPIDCVHTKDIPEDVLNTYCWIHSTYALKSMFLKKTGKEVPYPGVGNSEGKTEDRKVYKYYQWVCFCLFFQVMKGYLLIYKLLRILNSAF